MSGTIIPDATADEPLNYEEAINHLLDEMGQANEKMERGQEEIERLKAETREILARLKAS
ncbi:MAG TPA: hypothetical protein VM943_03695 [Pyrinomonadaceae bacterium]|nr:hypothetical protein [Pyrinomonadaceae bacterium]